MVLGQAPIKTNNLILIESTYVPKQDKNILETIVTPKVCIFLIVFVLTYFRNSLLRSHVLFKHAFQMG